MPDPIHGLIFRELSGIAERGRLENLTGFNRLAYACGGKMDSATAWKLAHECRIMVWDATCRIRQKMRNEGDWARYPRFLFLGIRAGGWVAKGYIAALLRSCHIVDVVDLQSSQTAFERYLQLAA